MSNTVITNFTDLNGPASKTDKSLIVIVNKDGSLSLDKNVLDTLMYDNEDLSKATPVSVVRIGADGKPDDATDSDDDNNVPHVNITVDGYFCNDLKVGSRDKMQELSIETMEICLAGFNHDHCYTSLYSPGHDTNKMKANIPSSKKITILEQQIIPKGKKLLINPSQGVILKGNDILTKPLPGLENKIKTTGPVQRGVKTDALSESIEDETQLDSDDDAKLRRRFLMKGKSYQKRIIKLNTKNLIDVPGDRGQTITLQKGTPELEKTGKKRMSTPLLTDVSSLFASPDVMRRISGERSSLLKKTDHEDKNKGIQRQTRIVAKSKEKGNIDASEKNLKELDSIPHIDDASLVQILQSTGPKEGHTVSNPLVSPGQLPAGLAGPLSPTLDLLGGLQPEEEGLSEDLLMHVAQLVESSENLQEVIDKQVLGKVDNAIVQQNINQYSKSNSKTTSHKEAPTTPPAPRKDPIQIVKSDGRVITLPPIEAPATRSSKRKTQTNPSEPLVDNDNIIAKEQVIFKNPEPEEPTPQIMVSKPQSIKKVAPSRRSEQGVLPQVSAVTNSNIAQASQRADEMNSEDDPYRLWCICNQPHNNRFMICCDSCEDWFHGKCVNITKAMGQQMEEQGIEWTCPNCRIKKKQAATSKKITDSRKSQDKNSDSKKHQPEKKNTEEKPNIEMRKSLDSARIGIKRKNSDSRSSLDSSGKLPPRKSSEKAFHSKLPQGLEARGSKPDQKESQLKDTICIVCKAAARPSSIYCSDGCILKHAQESLTTTHSSTPGKSLDNCSPRKPASESRVIVFERKTGRCLAGPSAPTAENLKQWLQEHPTFEVVRPGTLKTNKQLVNVKKDPTKTPQKIQSTLKFEKKPKPQILAEDKEQVTPTPPVQKGPKLIDIMKPMQKKTMLLRQPPTPRQLQAEKQNTKNVVTPEIKKAPIKVAPPKSSEKTPQLKSPTTLSIKRKEKPEAQPQTPPSSEPIRENVRKALVEHMTNRMTETITNKFTDEEIKSFGMETEAELYDLFKDVGTKYKAKYRSLIFNIKDRKNLTLWQKICDKSISPKQLVRFTAEELASQELAQWRDKEAKHQLELIKKSELDLLAASKTYVLKTHKGEEVMESKSSSSTLDPNVSVEDLVTALNDSVTSTDTADISRTEIKSKTRPKSKHATRPSSREKERSSRSSSRQKSHRDDKARSTKRRSGKGSDKDDSIKSSPVPERRSSRRRERSRERSRDRERRSERKDRSKKSPLEKSRHRSRSKHRSISSSSKNRSHSRDKESVSSKHSEERPKSSLQKDIHPEYDPHERMVTSVFSEEEPGNKSNELYELYDNDNEKDYDSIQCDPDKIMNLESSFHSSFHPAKETSTKLEKVSSGGESDQEPTSTVDTNANPVWNGCINMVDVARFYVAAHEISGAGTDLEDELNAELDIVGRINPETVWEYISKMKRAGNKDILVLRMIAANDEEKMQYIALYSYLSSRKRLGVVHVTPNMATVKDLYIVPVEAGSKPPEPLGSHPVQRAHTLLALVIRQRRKRTLQTTPSITDLPPLKLAKTQKSYTPPSSPKQAITTFGTLSTSVKDKIAATLASADDENEPYTPGGSSSDENSKADAALELQNKMDELNRQIMEEKEQILNMQRGGPIKKPSDEVATSLSDIALPSNLQEILASIQRGTTKPTPSKLSTLSDEELLKMVPDQHQ